MKAEVLQVETDLQHIGMRLAARMAACEGERLMSYGKALSLWQRAQTNLEALRKVINTL